MKYLLTIIGMAIVFTAGCARKPTQVQEQRPAATVASHAGIPQMSSLGEPQRTNIKKTCHERWVPDGMNMATFRVRPDHDGYLITCESLVNGVVYLNTIRTDKEGNWVNDGRAKKSP